MQALRFAFEEKWRAGKKGAAFNRLKHWHWLKMNANDGTAERLRADLDVCEQHMHNKIVAANESDLSIAFLATSLEVTRKTFFRWHFPTITFLSCLDQRSNGTI